MHTELTLQALSKSTKVIGQELRLFRDSSRDAFATMELPGETATRGRRQKQKGAAKVPVPLLNPSPQVGHSQPLPVPVMLSPLVASQASSSVLHATPTSKAKFLNLSTYKLHALGDYMQTIRLYGTTDSYSTQTVSYRTIETTFSLNRLINLIGRACSSAGEKVL